jgi:hypothetical protein
MEGCAAGLELAGNGLELDSEMSGNGWSPYRTFGAYSRTLQYQSYSVKVESQVQSSAVN